MTAFRDILRKPDPFYRCNGVYCLLADLSGNQLDAEHEPEPLRTITLVWFSSGIIGNGGFGYLFMADLPGDPGFVYTAASYSRIGAKEAYLAFLEALALFPHNAPPLDIDERRRVFDSFDKERVRSIEMRFWDADKEVIAGLDAYITANADAIEAAIKVIS